MLLTVCIIARDSAHQLVRAIKSIKELADEVIVIDIGSIDETAYLSRKAGANVYSVDYKSSIGQARNLGLKKANGKWILFLNPNEELFDDYQQLRSLLKNSINDGYYLPVIELNYLKKTGIISGLDTYKNFNIYNKQECNNSIKFPRLSLRLFQRKYGNCFNNTGYQDITSAILEENGEASLKILHLPVIFKPNYSEVLSETCLPFVFPLTGKGFSEKDFSSNHLKKGIKFYRKDNYMEAIYHLEAGYWNSQDRYERSFFLKNIILLLIKCKNHKRVEKKIQIGLKEFPEDNIFLFWQGYLKHIYHNYNDSNDLLKQILAAKFVEKRLKKVIYILFGLNYFGLEQWARARSYLKQALDFFPENRIIIKNIIKILEKESKSTTGTGLITDIIKYFNLNNPEKSPVFFLIVDIYYQKKEYKLLQELLERDCISIKDNNMFSYWKAKVLFQLNKKKQAENIFKEITPDFNMFEKVLELLWILSLTVPGKNESKSIINQIKLLGNKTSSNLINIFNRIYLQGEEVFFKFDNLIAKLNFYQNALVFLNDLLEFNCQQSIKVMLDIISSLNIKRSNIDTGVIFYQHGYYKQAYHYLKSGMESGYTLINLKILADVCKKVGKEYEYREIMKKIKIIKKMVQEK